MVIRVPLCQIMTHTFSFMRIEVVSLFTNQKTLNRVHVVQGFIIMNIGYSQANQMHLGDKQFHILDIA